MKNLFRVLADVTNITLRKQLTTPPIPGISCDLSVQKHFRILSSFVSIKSEIVSIATKLTVSGIDHGSLMNVG